MKKIMNEWKNWLLETAPTEKEMPQAEKPEGSDSHDRALADYYRGKFQNALKTGIGNYLKSGDVTALHKFFKDIKSSEDMELRSRVAKALIGMHHIYKNRDDYGGLKSSIPGSSYYPSGSGFLFNDQPIIQKDPAKTIKPILKMMGDMRIIKDYLSSNKLPTGVDLDNILSTFISQNVASYRAEPEAPNPTSRFSRALSMSPEKLAQMNKDLYKRNK